MSPWNVTMECYHGMSPWNVTMECYHGMSPWNFSMECHHGMLPWNADMECCHRMQPWDVAINCHHEMSPWNVTMRCYHELPNVRWFLMGISGPLRCCLILLCLRFGFESQKRGLQIRSRSHWEFGDGESISNTNKIIWLCDYLDDDRLYAQKPISSIEGFCRVK